ncbi:hypothetical protein Tco_1291801 [Tanacetum coccineum]
MSLSSDYPKLSILIIFLYLRVVSKFLFWSLKSSDVVVRSRVFLEANLDEVDWFNLSLDIVKIVSTAVCSGTAGKFSVAGLEVGSIRRIQGLDTAYWGFLGVGTTFDIFQNIHILYLEYGVLSLSGYGVLNFTPLWSLVSAGTDTPYLP